MIKIELCRLFKSYTGKTFSEYLTFYRLDQAYKLLIAATLLIHVIFIEKIRYSTILVLYKLFVLYVTI